MTLKSNELSDRDIIKILKSQNININNICMKDELPAKLRQGFYITNLQSSRDGQGSHWTSFYYNSKRSYYFDPYGFVPP